jgi:hypothetical protein
MSLAPTNGKTVNRTRRSGVRFAAVLIALVSLAAVAAVWFWMSLLAISVPLLSWQTAVIIGGSGTFCLSTLVALGLEDLLEWLWAVLAAVAAVGVAVCWGVMSIFGWD